MLSHLNDSPKPKIVVLTGAGMSAESGVPTFRGAGGLWEGHHIEDVATPEAWKRNPELVLRFYNERRRHLSRCVPNEGHHFIHQLEDRFYVHVITQNIDDLHERAGSTQILHLHGELTKARSTQDDEMTIDIGYRDLVPGDKCPLGSQLRPHVVWFHEDVPMMPLAAQITRGADVLVVVGTSLSVYPAASLVDYVPHGAPVYVIDPSGSPFAGMKKSKHIHFIKAGASEGLKQLGEMLDVAWKE